MIKKKVLTQLVQISYDSNQLDQTKVNNIVHLLSRKELKQYINKLKAKEKELTVEITVPNRHNETEYAKIFQPLFTGNKLKFSENKELLLGIRITANDLVYDLSFQNTLQQIRNYVEKIY